MYLRPRPGPAEIGGYYADDYAPFRPAVEDERWGLMRWMRRRKLAGRRRMVERYSGLATGRILDVGCATGLFLHEMALAGWQADGVEPMASAADYARQRFGLPVFEGMIEDAPYPPASFDVVTFWDVLEHVFSPAHTLHRTAALLRPGGLLAINAPNWDSYERAWFGRYWIGLDPPRHLYVFTRATLTALLEQSGFRVLGWECFMPTYFSFIASVERRLQAVAPDRVQPVMRVLNFPGVRLPFEPAFGLANRLERGGVIAVFARKEQAHG
jgi:SAM-dependent methyltransferase